MKLLLLLVFIFVLSAARKLEFVQSVWRHGDRAPIEQPYPTDRYTEEYWPRGWGMLTNIGMRQLKNLGQFMRARYATLTKTRFDPSEVYLVTSNVDRTSASAQSFSYGFYPATGADVFESGLPWQPTPIHGSSDGVDDWICRATSINCPKYNDQYAPIANASIEENDREYADLFSFLSTVTGISNFSTVDTFGIYDINRELANNLTQQPDWVYRRWEQYGGRTTLQIATDIGDSFFVQMYSAPNLGRRFTGYLLGDFITTALNVANGTQKNPSKMKLYSSHDTVLSSLMYTMGVGDGKIPTYGAAIIMEVYSDPWTVEFVYRNDSTRDPYPIYIPDCGYSCSVKKLSEIYTRTAIFTIEEAQEVKATKNI
ncbi:unnamed protein product [Auanema sp. JU1783]|nr:unnamed protein product [Auanema sp. JU1783]